MPSTTFSKLGITVDNTIVTDIRNRRAAGQGNKKIAVLLNKLGTTPPGGRYTTWRAHVVEGILGTFKPPTV